MKIKVRTDHQSLSYIKSLKNPTGRLGRWALYFDQFDMDVEYRKGSLNVINDVLSREPLPWVDEREEDYAHEVKILRSRLEDPSGQVQSENKELIPSHVHSGEDHYNHEIKEFTSECACKKSTSDVFEGKVRHICEVRTRSASKSLESGNKDREMIPKGGARIRTQHKKGETAWEESEPDIPPHPEIHIDNTYGISLSNLVKAQKNDLYCRKVMEMLSKWNSGECTGKEKRPEYLIDAKSWRINKDALEKCVKNRKDKKNRWLPVVPQVYKEIILRLGHSSPLEGHRGGNTMETKLSKRFYWIGLRKDVRDYIKGCYVCQQVKPDTQKKQGLFSGGEIMEHPFSIVAVDFMGPYPTTAGRKDQVHIGLSR